MQKSKAIIIISKQAFYHDAFELYHPSFLGYAFMPPHHAQKNATNNPSSSQTIPFQHPSSASTECTTSPTNERFCMNMFGTSFAIAVA